MIEFNSNAGDVFASIAARLQMISDQNIVIREVAVNLLPEVRDRIHVRGEDASGGLIGTYSEEYMKVRTGLFSTNATFTKGKNKGATKSTGVFTKGKNKGSARPNFNRDSDRKVVISLTRQMEQDFSVQESGGRLGLGYNNPVNADKAAWVEETYNKKILALTPGEHEKAVEFANDAINNILNNRNAA